MGSNETKKKFTDLDEAAKNKVKKVSMITLAITAMVCCVLVGCFACKQERMMDDPQTVMTDEQKAAYWTASIADVRWEPQTDETHDGVLKDLFLPREAKTLLDANTRAPLLYFMLNDEDYFTTARIELDSESGKLILESDDQWEIKFSEKNEVLFMTITDSDGKTVYYQQK